jgi:hypothetical protein
VHELACTLRPRANGALTPPLLADVPPPPRHDPFPGLVPSWSEEIAFDITVNATSEEGIAGPVIYGPFTITEIALRSSASGGASQQVKIAIGDDNTPASTAVGTPAGVPDRIITDTARTVPTYYATNVYERHQLHLTHRTGTARLQIYVNNTTAGAVTIVGHIAITHLVPDNGTAREARY